MTFTVPITTTELIWIGFSGAKYIFRVHPIGEMFWPNQPGNYIYAKIDQFGFWQPVYIGQGDLAERSNIGRHHQGHCILSKVT